MLIFHHIPEIHSHAKMVEALKMVVVFVFMAAKQTPELCDIDVWIWCCTQTLDFKQSSIIFAEITSRKLFSSQRTQKLDTLFELLNEINLKGEIREKLQQ